MHKHRLTIAYDGTDYGGWQVQKNAPSIQSTIENVLKSILQEEIRLIGSGRTDAGVHAHAQVAHFTTKNNLLEHKILHSLNSLLPKDIRITTLRPAPAAFHARYSAKAKTYHYHLAKTRNPFKERYSYHPHYPLSLSLLEKAAAYFVGTHDFSAFAHESHRGSASHDPIRTLYRLTICEEHEGVRLEFEGDGFLYKMVRNIVGTLLEVCQGKISLEQIPLILASKDRKQAGRTAPPQGLFLAHVTY